MNIKLYNVNVLEDLKLAKEVINGKINKKYFFNSISSIYKTTNENISDEIYTTSLKNKNRVLSVIGSGDQIINTIFLGAKKIVGIDISRFPKYFLPLKLASIKKLDKDDYLEYFYGFLNNPFMLKYYEKIRDELDDNSRTFWDDLYDNYEYNAIYNSYLFTNFNVSKRTAVKFNPFLQKNNYNLLKEKFNNVSVELFEYNIFDINNLDIDKFDLIILSNVINYINRSKNDKTVSSKEFYSNLLETVNMYKSFLKKLPLNKGGLALTYNFIFNGELDGLFNEKEYVVNKVDSGLRDTTIKNELLIYKKMKK